MATSFHEPDSPFRLAVLNPGGNDPDQVFLRYAGAPAAKEHPPLNYHAYAACTAGGFYRYPGHVPAGTRAALVLLRRDLKLALRTVSDQRARGVTVAVALKETGAHQVAALLADARRMTLFRQVCALADFCLAATQEVVSIYLGAGARRTVFVPTPYPVEESQWDFSRSLEPASTMGDRRGVFIGTREFDTPSRNHLAALLAARRLGEPVTVVNLDGRRGRKLLGALGFTIPDQKVAALLPDGETAPELRIVDGRMDYTRYLQIMAGHRIVFQLDRSAVPGQVAGDALLCRVPCVGGDSAVERIAFPGLSGYGREPEALVQIAGRLLRDDDAYAATIEQSQRLAREELSFGVVARKLRTAFE